MHTANDINAKSGGLVIIAFHGADEVALFLSNFPISFSRYCFSVSVINGWLAGSFEHNKN